MSSRSPVTIVLVFLGGIVATLLFSAGLSHTNTMEFCTSCHSMQFNLEEYKQTIHFKNPSGMKVGCPDCHVPRDLGPTLKAKLLASRDIWHEIMGTIDTKEKFENRRWMLANRVWDRMKETDSRECRACHSYERMDLEEQEKIGRKRHSKAMEEGKTCIECHKGIAHAQPYAPDE